MSNVSIFMTSRGDIIGKVKTRDDNKVFLENALFLVMTGPSQLGLAPIKQFDEKDSQKGSEMELNMATVITEYAPGNELETYYSKFTGNIITGMPAPSIP